MEKVLRLDVKEKNKKMNRLNNQNINTSEYWNKTFESEIKRNRFRVEIERFERTMTMIEDNTDVIDIGCGRGEFVEYLLKYKKQCRVLGIDFSKTAIEDAKKRIHNARFADIDVYKLADYSSLLKKHDYAVCFEVIEHLDRPDILINNIYEILKPNGYLILSTPYDNMVFGGDEHVFSFSFKDMCNFFENNKWNIITLTRYQRKFSNMFVLVQKI